MTIPLRCFAELTRARPGLHACQFHDTDESLCDAVALFAGAGLEQEDAVVLVASADHLAGVRARLAHAHDLESARARGRWVEQDAAAMLERIAPDGRIDRARLRGAVLPLLESPIFRACGKVRIYGEMVSLLWRSGQSAAAIELEEAWSELASTHRFALLCGYLLEGLDERTYTGPLHEVGRTHTDVLDSEYDERLLAAVDAATEDVLGISFSLVLGCSGREQKVGEHRLPSGRRTLLWLHRNMPVTSRHIVERARRLLHRDAAPSA
jgi:hypothetical protein